MKIYEDQLQALSQSQAALFEDRVIMFVVDRLCGGARREVSRSEIRSLIAEAHGIGLDTERPVVAYVVGKWLHGERFEVLVEPHRDRFSDGSQAPSESTTVLLRLLAKLGESTPLRPSAPAREPS